VSEVVKSVVLVVAAVCCVQLWQYCNPAMRRVERILVWASDDEEPQEERYELRVNGRVVQYEHVRIELAK